MKYQNVLVGIADVIKIVEGQIESAKSMVVHYTENCGKESPFRNDYIDQYRTQADTLEMALTYLKGLDPRRVYEYEENVCILYDEVELESNK